jgi:hypothetical protein
MGVSSKRLAGHSNPLPGIDAGFFSRLVFVNAYVF